MAPVAPAGMPKVKSKVAAEDVPELLTDTVGDDPADRPLAEAVPADIVAAAPSVPLVPSAPEAPVAPRRSLVENPSPSLDVKVTTPVDVL